MKINIYFGTIQKDKKGYYILFPKEMVKEYKLEEGDIVSVHFERKKYFDISTKAKARAVSKLLWLTKKALKVKK
jgi:hypothetical protein